MQWIINENHRCQTKGRPPTVIIHVASPEILETQWRFKARGVIELNGRFFSHGHDCQRLIPHFGHMAKHGESTWR